MKSKSKKPEKEVVVCDLSLVYIGDDEFSFEEIRAIRSGYRLNEDVDLVSLDDIKPFIRKPLAPKLLSATSKGQVKIDAMPIEALNKYMNSPTINTKAAQEDVFGMFNRQFVQQVEEDQTISAKVYQQDAQRVNIFADESIQGVKCISFKETSYQIAISEDVTHNEKATARKPRLYSLMTPITETDERNFDEKLFTGLSSIRTAKGYDSTMGEKSILNRTQDFTFPNRSFIEPNVDHTFAKQSKFQTQPQYLEVTPKRTSNRISTPAKVNTSHLDTDSEDVDIFENPCDPRSGSIFPTIVSSILPYLKSLPCLTDCRHDAFSTNLTHLPTQLTIKNNTAYTINSVIGKGVNAIVYHATQTTSTSDNDSDSDLDSEDPSFCLKLQSNPSPWEFYIQNQLKLRLPQSSPIHKSIPTPHTCHIFKNKTLLVMSYHDKGTLLNHINTHQKETSEQPDELLCFFWAIELMKTVAAIHKCGMLHGDIKSDNVLLRGDTVNGLWNGHYSASGLNGWCDKGIVLCDWGSAIDLKLFPATQLFINENFRESEGNSGHECWTYRNGIEYKYGVDWYGVAGVVYASLFGRYMEVVEIQSCLEGIPMLSVKGVFKRYWQCELWTRFFELMLNSEVLNGKLES